MHLCADGIFTHLGKFADARIRPPNPHKTSPTRPKAAGAGRASQTERKREIPGASPPVPRRCSRLCGTVPRAASGCRAREAIGNQRPPWPADKVERWRIDRLIPYAKNARTHTDAQVAAIAASIKEWGWTTPALVGEDGGLIAGHARVLAARQLGIAEIPVMVAVGWTEAQKRAYVLADNQLAITGSGWDPELLRLELGELKLGACPS